MKILVTGSEGFIGKNLILELEKINLYEIFEFKKTDSNEKLKELIFSTDFIIHLAGVNRTNNNENFHLVNSDLTKLICDVITQKIKSTKKHTPLLFASSTQVTFKNEYGLSKLKAENHIKDFSKNTKNPSFIMRLPNVFGKWCKPNYNSVVATFCSNIANDKEITINNPEHQLTLVYIDDLINQIINLINEKVKSNFSYIELGTKFNITVGDLAKKIMSFKESRTNLMVQEVGNGFDRCLYATFLSYLKPEEFSYKLKDFSDSRGSFVEFLKTKNSGQFSFFTAHPGVTRGGHYHNTKNEKFLIVQGNAKFRFFNVMTKEKRELIIKSSDRKVDRKSVV